MSSSTSQQSSARGSVVECIKRINSVDEYLKVMDELFKKLCLSSEKCELWFRGQPRASFNLIPSIARGNLNPELELIYLSKFKSYAMPYVEPLPAFPIPDGKSAYWHWLFLMQHYGVPTRLLDWSRDALTALFFAVNQSPLDVGNDAAVWILNPTTLNKAFSFHSFVKPGYIPNVDEEVLNLYFGPNAQILETKKPAAVIGPLNSTRIIAQRGTFTVFPRVKNITPFNLLPDSSDYLLEMCIAKESIDHIKTQLQHYGITNITLFPEIQSINHEINLEIEQEEQVSAATIQ